MQAFRDIASLLGRVFADSELVPSDVVAGLVLLSHQRNRQQQWCSRRAEGRVVGGEPTQGTLLLLHVEVGVKDAPVCV